MNTVMDYINRVTGLYHLDPDRKKPVFIVAGAVNAGKSTLANGLAGQLICPEDASPSTFFPVQFDYSEKFSALKTVRGRSIQLGERELREALRNKKKPLVTDKIQVFLPSEILRWCSLVDLPGIGLSGEADGQLKDYLARADGIIFLFHQRGIDEAAHSFLNGLASYGIKGWIAFLVNANLGLIDGSSLLETGQAIKRIFPGRSEIHAINTRDRYSIDLVSLFLRVRAMDYFIGSMEEWLTRVDKTLPGMVERALLQPGDDLFMLRLWDVLEKAGVINTARQSIRDLPLIYSNMVNLLRDNNRRLTVQSPGLSAHKKAGRAGLDPKEAVASLLNEIRSNAGLARYDRAGLLQSAREALDQSFRVMLAGPFSTGKTTFLNALLGETLLPAEDRATTSCPAAVRYGSEKTAEVERVLQEEFFPASLRDGKYTLNYGEILTLTQLLENPALKEQVGRAEIRREGAYKRVSLTDLAGILDEMCLLYNKNSHASARRGKGFGVPLFSRKIPAGSLALPPVTGVRIYPVSQVSLVYRLDNDRERLEFYRTISPPGSSLAKSVTLRYPSHYLSLADFIDTPGLDSLHKRHYDRASSVLSSGHLVLFFLHAKHVLAEGLPKNIRDTLITGPDIPVLYVINFADTISNLEREKVSLYVRQRLGQNTLPGEHAPYPRVYTISALEALRGCDEGFNRLMRKVKKNISALRTAKMDKLTLELADWLGKIMDNERQHIPDRVRQAALYYQGELERVRKRILGNGVN